MERKFRYQLALIPSIIFWVASIIFFIRGLSFGDTTGWMMYIAFALAIANTAIQVIGNDSTIEEIGIVLFLGWLASYVLGVSSNVNSLLQIIHIDNDILHWSVCVALGAMVEFLPERFWVLFWKTTFPYGIRASFSRSRRSGNQSYSSNQSSKGKNESHEEHSSNNFPPRPKGMPRAEYQDMIRQIVAESKNGRHLEVEDES